MSYADYLEYGHQISYWSYMAAAFAEHLEIVRSSGHTAPTKLPKGIHGDAEQFFELTLDALDEKGKAKPRTRLYVEEWLTRVSGFYGLPQPKYSSEIEKMLQRYVKLVEWLGEDRPLTPDELVVVVAGRAFFLELQRRGEDERHERYSDDDDDD